VEVSRVMLDTSAYLMLRRGHAGIRDTLQAAEAVYVSPGTRTQENETLLVQFLLSPRVWIAAGAMERGLRIVATDAHYRVMPQIRLEYHEPL
jgi:hypothetical protein